MAEVLPFPGSPGNESVAAAASPQCRRLARVLLMTQEMLERALEEDWDAVAERERERRDDLRRCFTEATPAEHGELVAEALAALLHLNEELMALLAAARERVLEQGVAQVRTRTAIDRYRDVNGGR